MDPQQSRHLLGSNTLDRSPQPLRKSFNPNQIIQRPLGQQNPDEFNEEDEYNRRRQEGIRRQLQQKEAAQAQQQLPFQFKQYDSVKDNYLSFDKGVAERDIPTSTHFTLGPQIREEALEPPPHIKEHLANLTNDNQSLMRRLNLVLQELERVKREREELSYRLEGASQEQLEIHNMMNNEDNVDKVNKYMQDDLLYERERNQKIKQQIKELDVYKSQLIRDLRKMAETQDNLIKENQESTYSLQQKLNQIQDLEREQGFTHEKIKGLNIAIENLKRQEVDENYDKAELQRILNQLMQERNDLLSKLDHLARKYDECVKEISQDREEMEVHNNQHAKLITAKIIFSMFETLQKQKLQQGFQEIRSYCHFDGNCHNKLSKIAKLMGKVGKEKMQIALMAWFSASLKPTESKAQSKQFVINADSLVLKQRMFCRWLKLYRKREQGYDSKSKAIQLVWKQLSREANIETKRAFLIWKEDVQNFRLQKTKVKKLIWKLYFNKLSLAMNAWANYSSNIDSQVRLNLLSKTFSQKQYLTLLFCNFKYQVYDQKRKRLNILFHCLKSWKDYLAYQKFVMGSNLVALQFKAECNLSIVKSCFDALKQNKEQGKYIKTHQILNEEERPMIEALQNENENIIVETKFKEKSKACETVKKMMATKLYGYFQQWKKINEDYKEKLRTTMKDKIIKVYMTMIREAFNKWRVKHNENKLECHEMVITEMQQEGQNLQNEVLSLQKDIQQRQEQKDCSSQKQVLKCVASYEKRLKQLAIGRWRDRMNDMNFKEDGAETIIKRLRLRYLRKAFDLYLAGVKYAKKLTIEEERCKHLTKKLHERAKAKVFNKWTLYKNNHKRAKNYWYRIFLRLEMTMKQMAVRKWREASQKKVESELLTHQHSVVNSIDELNHQIGEMHIQETQQQNEIKSQQGTLTTQARRIIANAFARFYYTNETRGFEKWKEYVQFEKKKERLLKKYLDHMKKQQFYLVASYLKNWILNAKVQERKGEVKKEEMKLADVSNQLEIQTESYEKTKKQLNEETQSIKQQQDMYNDRLQKSVQLIIGKVNNKHFTTQKQFIFQQWRQYVKREVHFINAIKNVIQKSLWNKGFQYIKSYNREVQQSDEMQEVLNKFRIKFWKRTCGNAFSVWRSGQYAIISATIQEVDSITKKLQEDHQNYKGKAKENNANRALKIMAGHNQRNVFQAWKNVIKYLKQQRIKDAQCNKELNAQRIRNALIKWNCRRQATKIARVRMARLKEKFHRIRLRLYFNALRDQFNNTHNFCLRIANLANIHDHQGLKASFNAIQSFAKAKGFVYQQKKQNSSNEIVQILEGILLRRKKMYLTELKLRSINKRKVEWSKGFTILYSLGNQMRYYFQKWKFQSNQQTLAKEMYEEGPIREEVFEDKMRLANLKELMTNEGYEPKEIGDALKEERDRQSGLLLKGIRRMQHYNEGLYLKPKVLDRWREYVQARKRFKYWLAFVAKRGEFIKSDLHQAFDTWKHFYPKQFALLKKLPKRELDKRMLRNNAQLENLADAIADKENMLDNLGNQRDTLVDHFIKAQRLALALWVNNNKQSLHQAFLRWLKVIKDEKNQESTEQLRKNIDLLQALKERISHFEQENDFLANENEELRQFSLDGYQIAKNVQALTTEREKLSVDLADKAQMIRKLLDENEKLTQKLRSAQDEAQSLIKSTMAGSSGFKTGLKGVFSPMLRSSNY